MGISSIVFVVLLLLAGAVFGRNLGRIISNIRLGRKLKRNDRPAERWMLMAKVALGQSKMVVRPVAGLLHIFVYVGFVIINIEILEIVLDGILGTHRLFSPLLGEDLYYFVINVFEVLAFLVLAGCVVFLIRRNILRLNRFHKPEMKSWPTLDANLILVFEILLMGAFLTMNAADSVLMYFSTVVDLPPGLEHYTNPASKDGFLVSQYLTGFLPDDPHQLAFIERFCWWFHIVGIFIFLNYIPFSKHFHILMAFPNVWYSNLKPKGRFTNIEAVTNEVKLMLDPSADPYATPPADAGVVEKFGAKDVTDLTWKNLMDAYTCTECGRCTSECPANQTGKLLSPRKIMMDTRDRLEELAAGKRKNGADFEDGKSLLRDYITEEELWACTTCNACVEACPVNIDPLNIIVDLRRFLIMEESKSPESITAMFNNVENNGAPWAFSQADRAKWINEN
jgi:heterodisulfide reductase subunit C